MNGQSQNNNTTCSDITEFLESKRTDVNEYVSHVSLGQRKGKFRLGRKDYDTLYDLLPQSNITDLGLAEKPKGDYMPVLVDVDLKVKLAEDEVLYDNPDEKRFLYTIDHVKRLVIVYQNVIREICADGLDEDRLKCVLLEKPYTEKKIGEHSYVNNGFHLHFPDCIMDKKCIRVHLFPRVKKQVEDAGIFDDIMVDDKSQILDDAVVSNPWLMYGCKKDGPNMHPYLATCCFDSHGSEKSVQETLKNCEIFDYQADQIDLSEENVMTHIARIMSIHVTHRQVTEVRSNLIAPSGLRNEIPEVVNLSNSHVDMFSNPTKDLAQASQVIKFLSSQRADVYSDWMKIGWILYNISGGSREGFDLWNDFSKSSVKYDETEILDKWTNSMERRSTPGLGTLIFMAKADNPEQYEQWTKEKYNESVLSTIQTGGTHNDLARMMFAMFRTRFRCASVSNRKWFQFIDHAWEEMEEGTFLRSKISDGDDGLVAVFESQIKEQRAILAGEADEAAKKMHEHRISALQKIILQLKNATYKNNIMREAQEVFYDKKFLRNLDQDRMKVAFNNGVYDLEQNIFRDGLPEDYISVKMPIQYKTFNRGDDDVKQLELFLEQMFPDYSVRKYFLDVYSEIFEGGNSRKIVLIWTGNGDNGKSVTQKLLEKLLGKLAIKFETTLLSGAKTKMGVASPEMARAKPPVRHATMDEPDNDEKLNCGKMKMLSGGDSYWARDLFQKGSDAMEVTPMFTLTLLCNSLPQLRHPDRATWNRIRVIPFESNFVDIDKCPKTYEEQMRQKKFPVDRNFGDKIPGMLEVLAWYLLKHRAGWPDANGKRTEFPAPDPPKVKNATMEYERQNDVIREFLETEYEESNTGSVKGQVIWENFKEWWKNNHVGYTEMPCADAQDFFRKLREKWGEPTKRGGMLIWHKKKAKANNECYDINEDPGQTIM